MYEHVHTRLSSVSVAWPCYSNKSHCSPHSSQQCVHMLLSTTRPLCCCGVHWEKFKTYPKGCGWDNRGPCSPAAAALLPAWARWWRPVSGFKRIFFFFPRSTQLDRRKYKHNTTQGCVFIIAFGTDFEQFTKRLVCVLFRSLVESRMPCSHHHLIPPESVQHHRRALWVITCTHYEKVYIGGVGGNSHMEWLCHTVTGPVCSICTVLPRPPPLAQLQ